MSSVRVRDVETAIARRFPPERAEDWDRVGLAAGDPDREVTGVHLALDPTRAAIADTVAAGANVLVTHHPAALKSPSRIAPGAGSGGVLFAALDAGVALINAHTNLDRDPQAGTLLPKALSLAPVAPIERNPMPMTLVTVYVPATHAEKVIDAMAAAGAGRIGDYERCSFTGAGTGEFDAPADATPYAGAPGMRSSAEEVRVEMVAPPSVTRAVIAGARGAHPYEEPLIVASDVAIARSWARLGMLSEARHGTTVGSLAALVAEKFGITPRVWGDPDAPALRVATATGSAGSLVGDALSMGAQALVAGEVRYHDALDAAEAGLAIVEVGHDVSEWPLVSLLEQTVRSIPGIDDARITVSPATPAWWTPTRKEG